MIFDLLLVQSKEEGKDPESIQLCTINSGRQEIVLTEKL